MPKVNRNIVVEIMKHHLGKTPREVKELPGGLVNFVYEATVENDIYIIRIADDQARLQYFLKEQWAVNKAKELKVPVPEILEVGNEASSFPYMILRRVEGRPAIELADRDNVFREMGKYTAVINSIQTSGYGHIFDWSSNQLSRKDTWKDFLEKEFRLDKRLSVLERHSMLSDEGFSRLKSVLREVSNWNYKPHLCHCDLRDKNILVNEKGKICAILDWEMCASNIAPQWDLIMSLDGLNLDQKNIFIEGYGLSQSEYRRMAPGMKALNIVNFAEFVEIALEEKDEEKRKKIIDTMRTRLRGALDMYSL